MYNIRSSFPLDLASAIRKADVLSGEFLRAIDAGTLARLEAFGLASVEDGALTRQGMAVRRLLMSGSEVASHELSRLADRLMEGDGESERSRIRAFRPFMVSADVGQGRPV